MNVPRDVPANVPADAAPPARGRAHKTRKGNGGTAPRLTGGPGGWRSLYAGLAKLAEDLTENIHIENNILFPKFEV